MKLNGTSVYYQVYTGNGLNGCYAERCDTLESARKLLNYYKTGASWEKTFHIYKTAYQKVVIDGQLISEEKVTTFVE